MNLNQCKTSASIFINALGMGERLELCKMSVQGAFFDAKYACIMSPSENDVNGKNALIVEDFKMDFSSFMEMVVFCDMIRSLRKLHPEKSVMQICGRLYAGPTLTESAVSTVVCELLFGKW